jgi:hypothetical protein
MIIKKICGIARPPTSWLTQSLGSTYIYAVRICISWPHWATALGEADLNNIHQPLAPAYASYAFKLLQMQYATSTCGVMHATVNKRS